MDEPGDGYGDIDAPRAPADARFGTGICVVEYNQQMADGEAFAVSTATCGSGTGILAESGVNVAAQVPSSTPHIRLWPIFHGHLCTSPSIFRKWFLYVKATQPALCASPREWSYETSFKVATGDVGVSTMLARGCPADWTTRLMGGGNLEVELQNVGAQFLPVHVTVTITGHPECALDQRLHLAPASTHAIPVAGCGPDAVVQVGPGVRRGRPRANTRGRPGACQGRG